MVDNDKIYGTLKDGTVLTDKEARKLVRSGFKSLKKKDVTIVKSSVEQRKPIRISIKKLPWTLRRELMHA
ncbi:hypothetical protein FACS1894125_6980 [Actinomycetota bacterium]|nr:hypothetical protein FACS1894125_6980 [Actinomycetota bacterium]